jgi:hypothetical protein
VKKVMPRTISVYQVFLLLLALDGLMLLLHLLFARYSGFFHVDHEQNLPTMYQSLKLIFFGGYFLWLNAKRNIVPVMRNFTIPLSLALIGLGLDELFQIHENIYRVYELVDWLHPSRVVEVSWHMGYRSSLWILYYLPFMFLFVMWCGYWLRYFQTSMKSNYWVIVISVISLFGVILAEIVSSAGRYTEEIYYWLVTVEEVLEMLFASTMILIGLKAINRSIKIKDDRAILKENE